MADIKIGLLPTWSGSATTVRWFVMNNSGNTESFKFSGYSSQLIPGPGANAYRTLNSGTPLGAGADDIVIGRDARTVSGGGIVIGKGAIAGGNIRQAIAIGYECSAQGPGAINVGYQSTANGDSSMSFGLNNTSSGESSIVYGQNSTATQTATISIGRLTNATAVSSITIGRVLSNSSPYSTNMNGVSNVLTSTGNYNNIFNGSGNTISGTFSGVTMLSCFGRTATRSNATFVENLVIPGYATLDYADDTAAAAGGVVLGQVYHTSGTLKIRIV